MKIQVFDKDRVLDSDLKDLIERRLLSAVGRFQQLLGEVNVLVRDENGPRGGIDKTLRLNAKLIHGEQIVISDQDQDVATAIARAADRLARTLVRRIELLREGRHESDSSLSKF
jgi:ribosome-associated translation inhibitor RaiA